MRVKSLESTLFIFELTLTHALIPLSFSSRRPWVNPVQKTLKQPRQMSRLAGKECGGGRRTSPQRSSPQPCRKAASLAPLEVGQDICVISHGPPQYPLSFRGNDTSHAAHPSTEFSIGAVQSSEPCGYTQCHCRERGGARAQRRAPSAANKR